MSKIIFYIFILAFSLISSLSYGQFTYSTKSKKAVKLFEKAKQAPNSLDPTTNSPDYNTGISFLIKALLKDPNFVEAHVLKGRYHEALRNYSDAIFHYNRALAINPAHSLISATNFDLASLQIAIGDYDKALENIDIFLKNPEAPQEWMGSAYRIKESARFALHALQHPKAFNLINIGPGINSAQAEYFPTLTVDGKTLLFTRLLPVFGGDKRDRSDEQEDFFYSNFIDNLWSKAIPLPRNINTENNEGAPSIAPDGKGLIFVACSDASGQYYGPNRSGKGSCDLFFTKKIGSRWTDPINLPGKINSSNWETQPSLSADGKTLYFIRGVRGKDGRKNSDIYVSYLQADGTWGDARPLPNHINTPFAEESVHIHPDGKTLYFASRGHIGMGGSDLYVTRMDINGNWSKAENLGYPINTLYDENSLMVSPTGEIAFLASDRSGGYGNLDLYYFELPVELQPTKTYYFDGLVFDEKTTKPIPGHFELKDLTNGKTVIISDADALDGTFTVALPVNNSYAIQVTYPGYFPYSLHFDMTLAEDQQSYHLNIPLNPITSKSENVLANVFFDLNKSTLREESKVELNQFANYLNENKSLKIELGGHTDSRGNATENMKLSADRAKAVQDYLISKGVSSDRLSSKGYGSSQPIYSDDVIAVMKNEKEKEKAHQANRRTIYKVIN
jgi:outer membrane protein OmpA-like peptidoglycan-associated protein/Tol biopolymer transport system component